MTPQEFAGKIKAKYPQYASMDDAELTQRMVSKYPQYASQVQMTSKPQQPQGLGGKIWDALGKPEQLSSQGLNQIAQMIPQGKVTGNLPADLVRGAPRIAADTLAQVAPGFVSRGSILTAGAAPALKTIGKAAAPLGKSFASGLEDWAGIRPEGSISEAFKDPTLMFSKGKSAAKPLYQAAQKELPYEETIFKGIADKKEIANKAIEYVDKGGKLEPQEGLIARKALDKAKKTFSDDAFEYYRGLFDKAAKTNEDIAAADPAHLRGLRAQALRSLAPKNVGGRFSPFKVGEGLALAHLGPLGKVAALTFSPAALGSAATGLGAAYKVASNPASAVTALQMLRHRKDLENLNPF